MVRTVRLLRDSNGNFVARKRLPDDVRQEYGRLYGPRLEAKFFARASVGDQEAHRLFSKWHGDVLARIDAIKKARRGEGIDLTHEQAHALAGAWYQWFVGQHEQEPGKPEQWDRAFWHLVDAMTEALPEDLQSEEVARSHHLLTEWASYPEVQTALRPIISDFGRTAQFLASEHVALTNGARDRFLDAALKNILPAMTLLERRAKGDYEPDDLPKSFPKFAPKEEAVSKGPTPRELFDQWIKFKQPAHSTVESWRTVFNALTRQFPSQGVGTITPEEAQGWLDGLITKERSAFTVHNTWLRATKTVCTWGLRRKLITNNPFAEAVVDVPRAKQKRPKWFYEHEQRTILAAALAITDTEKPDRAACRWIPWLQAYTGARPGEIAQLRGRDVEYVDDVWTLNLTPEAGTIKGGKARRVPIHPHLIGQGFREFANERGDGPLFYRPRREQQADLLNQKKSPAAQVCQRVAKWVREIGVTDEDVSPNHAWRHTFKLIGRRVQATDTLLDQICGHAPATVGRGYGVATLSDLARVIEKFPQYNVTSGDKEASGQG